MSSDELESTLAAARRAGPAWNAGRQQQLNWAVMARLDTRPRARSLILALGCAAIIAIGVAGWRTLAPTPSTRGAVTAPATPPGTGPERLADGSTIFAEGPTTVLRKTIETREDVLFELEAGGASFDVARRPSRTFRVHAGAVTVQVIGTKFRVRREAARSRITVDRGRVLVSWWGGSRELGAGEEEAFPPDHDLPPAPAAPTAPATPTRVDAPAKRASVGGAPTVPAVNAAGSAAVNNRPVAAAAPTTLFARADHARSEGKPDAAVASLREIVERYPHDPHAPMAAFTIGRLLLESLGSPRQAAVAFGQARALSHGGPLGEDALAREVEALHAAGEAKTARERADLYRQLFPNGPRLRTVMRFGGLRAVP